MNATDIATANDLSLDQFLEAVQYDHPNLSPEALRALESAYEIAAEAIANIVAEKDAKIAELNKRHLHLNGLHNQQRQALAEARVRGLDSIVNRYDDHWEVRAWLDANGAIDSCYYTVRNCVTDSTPVTTLIVQWGTHVDDKREYAEGATVTKPTDIKYPKK